MTHPFAMQVTIKAIPGQGQRLSEIMLQAADLVSHQPGCQLYVVMQSMNDPDQVLITEAWDSQDAHQTSLTNREILALVSKAKPLIEHMQHEAGRPLGGLGL